MLVAINNPKDTRANTTYRRVFGVSLFMLFYSLKPPPTFNINNYFMVCNFYFNNLSTTRREHLNLQDSGQRVHRPRIMPNLVHSVHRGHCVHQQFWTQRPCQMTLSTLSGDQPVGVRHRQPLKVDWKLEAHGRWGEPMVRPRHCHHQNLHQGFRLDAT